MTPSQIAEIAASILAEHEHRGSGCWIVETVTNKVFGQLYDHEEINEACLKVYAEERVRVIDGRLGSWFTPKEALAIAATLDPQRVKKVLDERND